jgi:hypothetical protein
MEFMVVVEMSNNTIITVINVFIIRDIQEMNPSVTPISQSRNATFLFNKIFDIPAKAAKGRARIHLLIKGLIGISPIIKHNIGIPAKEISPLIS